MGGGSEFGVVDGTVYGSVGGVSDGEDAGVEGDKGDVGSVEELV